MKPFFFEEKPYGIFRAGLSLDGYNAVMRGSRRQTIVVSGVLFLIGIVVFTLLALNQTFEVVNKSYTEIRSFTTAVLESMETGVVAVDSQGRVTVLNQAAHQILKVNSSVLLRPYDEVFPDDPLRLKELLSGKETGGEFETEILGSTVSVSISPLYDSEEKVSGGTALLRDVTAIRKMEQEMKQSERLSLLGDTAASVAHEVRNPLNAISMAAQRLEEEYAVKEGMESAKNFSRILRQEVKRLDGIVSQFLSLARPSELNLQKSDLNRLVTETVALAEGEAGPLSVEINALLGDIPELMLDPDELKKAVINILRNGMEAAGKGGSVSLSTRVDGDMVALRIEDTGKGMSKEKMRKVFQPYFTTKERGTGLGLSIAQRVVADHGGRIDVDSTPGKGTVFTIWLNVPPFEGSV
ncbi:PAS domain-containing protein [candidate division TA06 bacterium]|uniref:histidine kinase n=1 Tax=candidate division TA06 bacterium TaxID=2250710 RepID=A0A523XT35_UNCT6|nr:MAG: PAS domain-containing protein [candidate division TA06 bacterium]